MSARAVTAIGTLAVLSARVVFSSGLILLAEKPRLITPSLPVMLDVGCSRTAMSTCRD